MRNQIQLATIMALIAGLFLPSVGNARIFKNKEGREISAEITGIQKERVELTSDGKKFLVPIADLSEADQEFIAEWALKNRDYRLRFSTKEIEDEEKRDRDVKGGRKVVASTWRYDTTITNLSGVDIENLEIRYNYFLRTTSTSKEFVKSGNQKKETSQTKTGTTMIPKIENSYEAHFSTNWEDVISSEWEVTGTLVSSTTGQSAGSYTDKYKKETIVDGIWIRAYLGDRMIEEWKSEGKVIKDATWTAPPQPFAKQAKVEMKKDDPKPVPIGNVWVDDPTILPDLPKEPTPDATPEVIAAFKSLVQFRKQHEEGIANLIPPDELKRLQEKVIKETENLKTIIGN